MTSKLDYLLERIIRHGSLEVIAPQFHRTYGDGCGETITLEFTSQEVMDEIANDPALKLAEAYMQGSLQLRRGDIYQFLALVKDNTLSEHLSFGMIWRGVARLITARAKMYLPVNHNKRNVAHHYDLTPALFDLFLDRDWQYSCAYFEDGVDDLDEAQVAKKRHIAAKLLLKEGQRVLEIGSGWGGMALYLAESSGVEVTGLTLSEEQFRISNERAAKRHLQDRVGFKLKDYRDLPKEPKFDRIVSIGMFEHVGPAHYKDYFDKVKQVMSDDGVMLLHSIGQPSRSLMTNPFIEKYIFPGGYIPALSEVLPAIENAGLLVRDIEILPIHYAKTLRHWRERFMAKKEEVLKLCDADFLRMWEFYLAGSEMAFSHENFFIFQVQLTHNNKSVPLTRDYIAEEETRLRQWEKTREPLQPIVF